MMIRPRRFACASVGPVLVGSLIVLGGGALGAAPALAAQAPPPIDGVTGTIAPEGTVEQEYAGANTAIVKSLDGVEHVFHYTKDLLLHGGKSSGAKALPGLREGSTVAVHDSAAGVAASTPAIDLIDNDGTHVTEGTVIRIDRSRKHIAIMFDHDRTETFELTDRTAAHAGHDVDPTPNATTTVTVFYADESGRTVAHVFKKTT
jgi:hypothetical protein